MKKKNIFIVGAEKFNLKELETIENSENYNFISLMSESEVHRQDVKLDLKALLNKARKILDEFDGSIDGIIGYYDFPVTLVTFLLINEYNLPGPTLESGIKCENKYISRKIQSEVIPGHIPDFALVNPFKAEKIEDIDLEPPFWIKPVKAYSSQIGFRINNQADLDKALPAIRNKIDYFADPYNFVASFANLPEDLKCIDGYHCIAESLIGGHQCTLSGFVHEGNVETYGVVDSINYPDTDSFFYYLFPSRLPDSVKERLDRIAKKVMPAVGFNNSPFNIEFYYDEQKDDIRLLEINPRMSQSHSELYNKVAGQSNHQILVQLALGQYPAFKHSDGPFKFSAKLHYRVFHDGIVKSYPDEERMKEIRKKFPDMEMKHLVKEGQRLSELRGQDSYSYRILVVFLGGDSEKHILEKYNDYLKEMNIEIEKTG